MGVIFRNGIPYGATESDVTTVYEKADLYDLTDKREDHLYIVEEENKPYRYDLETDEFYPIGASDTPPILAAENQALIGNGNNWATGGAFNIEKFDNKNTSTYEPYEHWWALTARTEEKTDNLPEGIIIQGNKRKSFQRNPISNWGNMSFSSKLPYLALRDDSYCLFDNKAYVKFNDADVQITEKAQLTIGGDGSQRKYFLGYDDTIKKLDGPTIHIHVPTFVSIGNGRVNDCAGVVNFGGAYCFELTDTTSQIYTPGARRTDYSSSNSLKYKWGDATFMESFGSIGIIGRSMCQDGPLVKFNGNPTQLMQGTPWLQMDGASVFLMSKEGAFKMTDYATFEMLSTTDFRMHGQSQIYVGDNFRFKGSYMSGIETGGFKDSWNQDQETGLFVTSFMDTSTTHYIRGIGGYYGRESNIIRNGPSSSTQIAQNQDGFDQHSNIWFHHKGTFSYGTSRGGATLTTKIGGDSGSNSYYLIEPGVGMNTFIKFAPKNGLFDLIIDPDGGQTYTKFSPKGTFKKIIEPNGNFQFTLQGNGQSRYIIEPTSAHVQMDGMTHIENHSGTIIFRDNRTTDAPIHARGIPLCNIIDGTEETYFYTYKYHMAEIITEHQYVNSTIADLNDYITDGTSDYDIFKASLGTGLIGYQEGVGNVNSRANPNGEGYITKILGFVGGKKSDSNKDWTAPIQSYNNTSASSVSNPSSIFQMYDDSNFLMRAKDVPYGSLRYQFTSSVAYDMTSQDTAKASFEADTSNYNIFLNLIPDTWVLKDYTVSQNSSRDVTIIYDLIRDEQYTELLSDSLSPTFEMVGPSELRLHDGASIRGTTVNNEIQFQFDDGTHSVSFTVAELTALKALLTQIPIQVVQSASEATEPGIMYFVDGGGN